MLPNFSGDYILTYLSSAYGVLAAILICCILAVLIIFVFSTMLRQKNQLGMVMGVGGYIVVCYGLIGIVLSIYRYKNIYPRNMKIPGSRIRMVIVKDR